MRASTVCIGGVGFAPGQVVGRDFHTDGAIALVVFVDHARAPVIRMGLQNVGAHVLSDDDLRRIGAGSAGVATSGLQGGEVSQGSVPTPSPVFDWQGEYAYTLAVQALIYGFPYVHGAQTRAKWVTQTPATQRFSHIRR